MKHEFAERLKELRLEKKLTLKQAAEIFHVSRTSYHRWEQEKFEPSIDTLCAICHYFEVTADYLLGLTD